jgi:predicted transcriptional regulator
VAGSASTSEAQSVGGRASTADLVKALDHEIRRSILQFLLETAPASSKQIRRGVPGFAEKDLTYHLKILVTTGAVAKAKKQGDTGSISTH